MLFILMLLPHEFNQIWTESVFTSMYMALKPGGVLVTYCAKGSVKRTLTRVGFDLQSILGPPWKERN